MYLANKLFPYQHGMGTHSCAGHKKVTFHKAFHTTKIWRCSAWPLVPEIHSDRMQTQSSDTEDTDLYMQHGTALWVKWPISNFLAQF